MCKILKWNLWVPENSYDGLGPLRYPNLRTHNLWDWNRFHQICPQVIVLLLTGKDWTLQSELISEIECKTINPSCSMQIEFVIIKLLIRCASFLLVKLSSQKLCQILWKDLHTKCIGLNSIVNNSVFSYQEEFCFETFLVSILMCQYRWNFEVCVCTTIIKVGCLQLTKKLSYNWPKLFDKC